MNDLISREAVLKLFATHDGNYLYEAIRDMPPAQPDVTDTNVGDTISRQAVLQRLTDIAYNYCKTEGQAQVIDWLKTLVCVMPSTQPERKTGKLKYESAYNWFRCNVCRKIYPPEFLQYFDSCQYQPGFNFCPNCGADMRGEQYE